MGSGAAASGESGMNDQYLFCEIFLVFILWDFDVNDG